ncbi:hypothetical protein RchiOBHm_Chr5g0034201 [Rosa chinensis]|uniref:RING-type E3 ubiquitin transferase n=2 Tax=Rosa chinensis TaxID=74649 RepID=A0A2P6QAY9_ROSCH|nr:hypothetical protein RchiOBHm_Chr5g0034201 [Rosa chinensis]
MPMSRKYKFSATTALKMWCTLPKLLIFFFVFAIFSLNSVSSSATPDELTYADHCASIVPESNPKRYAALDSSVFHHTGFYIGGGSGGGIRSPRPARQLHYEHPNPIEFNAWSVRETDIQNLFNVQGSLEFERDNYHPGNVRSREPQSSVRFELSGFWSISSGKLCMVGSGSIYLKQGDLLIDVPALLKLNNLMNFTSISSLISGTLESLTSSQKDPNYFEPISMLILPRINYQYTLVSNISDDDSSSGGSDALLGSLQMEKFCSAFSGVVPVHEFDLKYLSHCLSAKNCTTPLSVSGLLPRIVALRDIECLEDQRRLRVLVEFSDKTKHWYHRALYPNTTFVGEGSWNAKKNQLHVVACRFLDATHLVNNSHVGDCSIGLSLSFPGIWTIGDTRSTAGHIWSNKTVTESGYFENITFESHETYVGGVLLKGQKYEYTQIDKVTKLCPRRNRTAANAQNTNLSPNPFPYGLRFNMAARKSEGEVEWGYFSPLSVGNQLYGPESYSIRDTDSIEYNNSSPYSISYQIFIDLGSTSVTNLISAEGIYDYTEGSLCMVGCRNVGSTDQQPINDSVDCEILLNFQWPPNPARKNSGFFKGSIVSTREKSDPLHFDHIELSPAHSFIADSYRRVEVEVILILMTITLACVFGALQLFHVKRHPDVLPSISILMVVILTLGYMIRLMYYFEAIFMDNTDHQNPFLGSGGRVQLSQFIVRVITVQTMVAFLLQLRLLQKIWSARSTKGIYKQLWDVEKKAVSIYAIGVLVAMVLLMSSKLQEHSMLGFGGCGAYAGLVVDGFLLPQILLNMVYKSKERALSVSFYTGTTFVRVLPHAYDLYRVHISGGVLAEPYIYASPLVAFYSTAWDAIIPIGGLLFAVIIFLQQKYGGRCFLPEKLRESGAYEKIPEVIEA